MQSPASISQPKGAVLFDGKAQSRPLTWKSIIAFLLVGLLTAALGFIATVDVDRLWLSAIKRQMAEVFAEEERLPASEKGTAQFYFGRRDGRRHRLYQRGTRGRAKT